jgi:hypothetical protein
LASIIVVRTPISPSPFKSWWKSGSSDCKARLEPDKDASVREIIAAGVETPDPQLIGVPQNDLILARHLLRRDMRP